MMIVLTNKTVRNEKIKKKTISNIVMEPYICVQSLIYWIELNIEWILGVINNTNIIVFL